MAALLQSPPSVSSRWTAIFSPCRVRRCEKLCTVNARREDDYHATLKALQSRGRTPRKSLGQVPWLLQLRRIHIWLCILVIDLETQVLQEDFTRCHIRLHLSSLLGCDGSTGNRPNSTKVVANIPFNITTDVVKQLLPMGDILSQVVLLVQDETALRLVDASLGTSEYRPINIFVNFYSDAEYKFKVPRTNFFPQPNVDGAVVSFKLKQPADYPEISSPKTFFSMVNSAFNGKRKMLRRSLQHFYASDAIEEALSNMGLPTTSRPGELTLENFVRLHNLLVKH
ncbi:ribosomal RNA small subunit methyltransferase, chloroplastic isoform X2 [Amborella trichopoda]|uniref:ribosomal RNA small subunit methyltransferase, chloroplastic isoform X2 n=1 Tax=Amborella trichopoda TaxID=13333 RepID=UPI0005D404AE|nr:ribosomal RNA small subunit methyltransferase, chloroplastic isoform X2 [Amborella trichopoda]|eukprot:XP_011628371.1 ribosomal RNA small subunit methyltransferase, chloroplastic isoform X2 [Amborella trichopoda]